MRTRTRQVTKYPKLSRSSQNRYWEGSKINVLVSLHWGKKEIIALFLIKGDLY